MNSNNESIVSRIRQHFPNIDHDISGKERIFLDNGAGSLVLKEAANAENFARINASANVDGQYYESELNEEILKKGREALAVLFNSKSPDNIFQAESASSISFLIAIALRNYIGKEGNVISTYNEHYSSVGPYIFLKKNGFIRDVKLTKINPETTEIDLEHMKELMDKNTKLIVATAESNLTGTKSTITQLRKLADENDGLLIIDGVHYAPQDLIDVTSPNVDAFIISMYKLFGPRGSFAYLSDNLLRQSEPYNVDPFTNRFKGSFMELGTRDQAIFNSSFEVVKFLSNIIEDKGIISRSGIEEAFAWNKSYLTNLNKFILEGDGYTPGLNNIKNVRILGIKETKDLDRRGSTFSFNFENIDDAKAEKIYWEKFGITVVGGNHFNLAHDYLSRKSVLRVTFLMYNTIEEARKFLKATEYIASI